MASNDPEKNKRTGSTDHLKERLGMSFDLKEKLKKVFATDGLVGVTRLLDHQLNAWKSVPMLIAIIGSVDSGKSSFINCIRNVVRGEDGYAEVGACQTTKNITEYPSPDNSMLVYVDVPGVGTPQFLKAQYLETIAVDNYDYYIIVSSGPFSEIDLWLAQELKQRNKCFLFLRTKIDQALENTKYDLGKDLYDEKTILDQIRNECTQYLEGIEDKHIYLISSRYVLRYDFPKLRETLVTNFPKMKRDAFLLSLKLAICDTKNLINMKREVLQTRLIFISMASAASGTVPIPGVNAFFDMPIIVGEMEFYCAQLGLDSESVKRLSNLHGISEDILIKKVVKYSAGTLIAMGIQFGAKFALGEIAAAIPIFGPIFGGTFSFAICWQILHDILDDYTKIALDINNYIYEYLEKKSMAEVAVGESNRSLKDSSEDKNCAGEVTDRAVRSSKGAVGGQYDLTVPEKTEQT